MHFTFDRIEHLHFYFFHRSQLPARSTRLLNRSRLQQSVFSTKTNGSDSPRSINSLHSPKPASRSSSQHGRDTANCSPDDHLFMLDKSLRNSMIQDVQYCKQQLLQLRSLLQEVSAFQVLLLWLCPCLCKRHRGPWSEVVSNSVMHDQWRELVYWKSASTTCMQRSRCRCNGDSSRFWGFRVLETFSLVWLVMAWLVFIFICVRPFYVLFILFRSFYI